MKKYFYISIVTIIFSLVSILSDKLIKLEFLGLFFFIPALILFIGLQLSIFKIFKTYKTKNIFFIYSSISYLFGFVALRIIFLFNNGNVTEHLLPALEGDVSPYGNIFSIFLNPFNYVFAVPAACVGLIIDLLVYLYRKHNQNIKK